MSHIKAPEAQDVEYYKQRLEQERTRHREFVEGMDGLVE